MIEALKKLFLAPDETDPVELEHSLHLAAAALLVEMSRADFTEDSDEHSTMISVLENTLDLNHDEVVELIELGRKQAEQATSLYEFTRLINDHYNKHQKLLLIEAMWRVAFADGDLDKYEERLIRQVSDLIYVSHRDFIRLKHKQQGS